MFTHPKKGNSVLKSLLFIVLLGPTAFIFVPVFQVAAEDIEITIEIDQGPQIADFTVTSTISITISGNFTLSLDSLYPTFVEFGILVPNKWKADIVPDHTDITFGGKVVPFNGTIIPNPSAVQGEYKIFIWAMEGDPFDPPFEQSYGDYSSLTINVIQNRVKLDTNEVENYAFPDFTINHSFELTNIGTEPDIFCIHIQDEKILEGHGWVITGSNENITLTPGETKNFMIEMYIPSNATVGKYSFKIIISSKGHPNSTSSLAFVTKIYPRTSPLPSLDFGLILIIVLIGNIICLAMFYFVLKN